VTTLTGHTAQTGDSFARIGATGSGLTSLAQASAQIIRSGTAQAGGATTITLDAGASATSSIYVGEWIVLTGGTGVRQTRLITAYNGGTKQATVATAWTTNPAADTTFAIVPSARVIGVTGSVTGSVASVTGAVGSVTGAVGSVTGNVGGNVVGSVASVTGAVGSVTGNVGGNVVGSVASVTGAVGSVTGNVGGNVVGSVGSVTAQVAADVTAISGDTTAADNLELDYDGTGLVRANSTIGTVTTLTGHTAQTGDSFARIGAPAGASVSADIAALPDSAAVNMAVDDAFTTIMADSIPADGVIPTREQALYMINQFLLERETSGVTVTVNKVDGTTALFTLTLDDGTSPTSITRAT
jgi:hypothetical protein